MGDSDPVGRSFTGEGVYTDSELSRLHLIVADRSGRLGTLAGITAALTVIWFFWWNDNADLTTPIVTTAILLAYGLYVCFWKVRRKAKQAALSSPERGGRERIQLAPHGIVIDSWTVTGDASHVELRWDQISRVGERIDAADLLIEGGTPLILPRRFFNDDWSHVVKSIRRWIEETRRCPSMADEPPEEAAAPGGETFEIVVNTNIIERTMLAAAGGSKSLVFWCALIVLAFAVLGLLLRRSCSRP